MCHRKGPMHSRDKESVMQAAEVLEEDAEFLSMQDIREFWESFKRDPLLRHEILASFYKYREKQAPSTHTSAPPGQEEEK